MAGTSARRAASPQGAARGSQNYETTLPPVVVRYMRRMKRQRVYPYQVRWKSGTRLATTAPVTVRLVAGGAHVSPSEATLDPADPNAKAVFYVTPLAKKGWLGGERVEVLHQGRKVQEIRLASKVVSQRWTWILLALTILVPWFWYNHVEPALVVEDFSTLPRGANVQGQMGQMMKQRDDSARPADQQAPKQGPKNGDKEKAPEKGTKAEGDKKGGGDNPTGFMPNRKKMEAEGAVTAPEAADTTKAEKAQKVVALKRAPGDYLDHQLDLINKDYSWPFGDWINTNAPWVDKGIHSARKPIATVINAPYVFIEDEWKLDFSSCLLLLFLVLTVLSAFIHRTRGGKRVGNPIPLPNDEAPAGRRGVVEVVG
jgi:hypothetical protein